MSLRGKKSNILNWNASMSSQIENFKKQYFKSKCFYVITNWKFLKSNIWKEADKFLKIPTPLKKLFSEKNKHKKWEAPLQDYI